jgi:hypothetical protein
MLTPSNSALLARPISVRNGPRLPWYVGVIGCIYYAWLGLSLQKVIPIFSEMLTGIGVELPLPTRLLFSTYPWLFPILFLGAVTLTIVKQIAVLSDSQRRISNYFLFFVGAIFPALVVLALYSPLFVLIHRLQAR